MLTRLGALILILLVILALSLIVVRANGVPAPDSVAALFQVSPGCRPPCWHDITPKKTTVEEAVAILRADKASVQTVFPKDNRYLRWDFTGTKGSGFIMILDDNATEVAEIWFRFKPDHTLTLGDAMLLYNTQATLQFAGNIDAIVDYSAVRGKFGTRLPIDIPLDPSTPITTVLYHTSLYNRKTTGPTAWKGFRHWTTENSSGEMCGEG
jgi:hypothetical protein